MMRAALALARRSLGRTWPNPAVGCVIVNAGRIIARGRTREGGRPHAEADAIAQADGGIRPGGSERAAGERQRRPHVGEVGARGASPCL